MELRVGDTIPADLRLIECMNFETDEALLTVCKLSISIYQTNQHYLLG